MGKSESTNLKTNFQKDNLSILLNKWNNLIIKTGTYPINAF